ncbi:uncharacterized protein LOC110864690 isoform X3 [Helianthus annuus]|uniref:uncharacterized protein LOC110864690 isoform X3 n=1 Tax=Helianthus annuus TaxID=4232 RepID=UPI000B90A02F|nr:uncharacterized protein LOC110864690 isoform X3 [Helianthus annuus]
MNRACFIKLCETLNTFGGLKPNRNMDIDEQVAIFLHIIAHNVKNRVMRCRFHRSGDTISRCVTRVCNAVIRLHTRLLKKPEPIPENSTEQRWKWFKTHKHGGKWKNKTLPRYEDLCVIFGKDRAQGKKAKTVIEVEEEVNMVEEEHQRNEDFDEISHNVGTDSSLQVEETSSVRSKKRKRARQVDPLVRSFSDAVVLFADRLKETSAELSEDIKFELDIKKKTLMMPEELSKMTSLSQLEKFQAIEKIKDDQIRVMTFWSLGEEEREAWIRFLLSS